MTGLRGRGRKTPQDPNLFLLSPPSPPALNLLPLPNLKKKRKEKEVVEEGEVVRQKELKQQKNNQGPRVGLLGGE